jgi:glycine dehydrogenase subunit 1
MREEGKDWTGNSVYLTTIGCAAYMAMMGPEGFREVGEVILQRSHHAAEVLAEIKGLRIAWPCGYFKEFVVNFDAAGKTVAQVNDALRARGIFGGRDLSADFPALGQSALYAVTEIHTADDIARLAAALREIVA